MNPPRCLKELEFDDVEVNQWYLATWGAYPRQYSLFVMSKNDRYVTALEYGERGDRIGAFPISVLVRKIDAPVKIEYDWWHAFFWLMAIVGSLTTVDYVWNLIGKTVQK